MDTKKLALNWPIEFQDLLSRQNFKSISKWEGGIDQTQIIYDLNEKIFLGMITHGKPSFPPVSSKNFHEGLWHYDLVEAFISLDSKKYLEINLSINGAWWACLFDDYRVRSKNACPVNLEKVVTFTDGNFNLVLGMFSYQELIFNQEYNISAIVSGAHYSLNTSITNIKSKPDFHLSNLRK